MMVHRLALWQNLLLAAVFALFSVSSASAQELTFLRIGTGATGGTYFPIGGIIANAISNPPGSLDCDHGGSCGIPGLIAVAVATQGSVENVESVGNGQLDMALTQADVAYHAFLGQGAFAGKAINNLSAVANLFPETLHVVVRRDGGIKSITDIKGKRVSLGPEGSGTLEIARIVLNAFGVSENQLTPFFEKVGHSADMLATGELDAFFVVGGHPILALSHVAEQPGFDLLPVMGPKVSAIRKTYKFLGSDIIPAETYAGVNAVVTIKVGAQLVVSGNADQDLIYGVTRALWHPNNSRLLKMAHPNGLLMEVHKALDGIGIPIHPGAARYYREIGLTPPSPD
ncbi:MAG: TAXI family TRAP transporter solute-binding subunit [Rhodospirillales bacterium]|nr:TAXI family TRAP transporter solute-binding subunit [Rhodospirillales bacterium]